MRGIVNVINEKKEYVCTLICLQDGHVSGLGSEMFKILNKGNVTVSWEPLADGQKITRFANMGCLGAHLVSKLKKGVGNVIMLQPQEQRGEPYIYTFYTNSKKEVLLKIEAYEKVIFNNTLIKFNPHEVERQMMGLL